MNESLLIELCSSDWAISETAAAVLERTVIRMLNDSTYKIDPIDVPIRANMNALVNMDEDSGNLLIVWNRIAWLLFRLSGS